MIQGPSRDTELRLRPNIRDPLEHTPALVHLPTCSPSRTGLAVLPSIREQERTVRLACRHSCAVIEYELNIVSTPSGTSRSNVVTKKPTRAAVFGNPEEGRHEDQEGLSKPGRRQPSCSPKKQPPCGDFSTGC